MGMTLTLGVGCTESHQFIWIVIMARKLQNYSDIFARQKEQSLSSADLSRKGSIDSEIVNLVNYINASNRYFTTSSCSGRIIIYEENNGPKRGCRWFYTTHEQADFTQVMSSLSESEEDAVLKFEPFILHVQCCSLEDAKLMHEVAVASGYRNSGITLSNKGKIMSAIRSTHSLEVPLTHKGELLVDEKYILFLVELANKKVKENLARITRFFDNLKSATKARAEKGTSYSEKLKPNKATDNIAKQTPDNSSQIKEHLQDDPFLCVMDECTIDAETGLFSIIYSEDG